MTRNIFLLLLLGLLCFAVIPVSAQPVEETSEETLIEEENIIEETGNEETLIPEEEQEMPIEEVEENPTDDGVIEEEEKIVHEETQTANDDKDNIEEPVLSPDHEEFPGGSTLDLHSKLVTRSGMALLSIFALQMIA